MERLTNASGELFGDPRPQETSAEGRSYFLWDIFTKVMFQDQEMAVRSSIEEQRYRRRQLVLTATYFTAAALMLVLPIVSYFQNRALARDVREAITAVQLDDRDDLRAHQGPVPLRNAAPGPDEEQDGGRPLWLRFGHVPGREALPTGPAFYNTALRRVLLGNQYERIEQKLKIFADNQDSPEWKPGYSRTTRTTSMHLKMYLLITWPHTQREPQLDEAHQNWLVDQMVRHWTHVKGSGGEANMQQAITARATPERASESDGGGPEQLAFARDNNDRARLAPARSTAFP